MGTSFDNHRLRAGLSELYEFGSEIDFHQPKLILYYQYKTEKVKMYFGSFPRRGLINFPLAMLTDTLLYYRPMVEGMFGEYKWKWGKQNAFVDWTSRQTDVKRETFMAGASGEINFRQWFVENYLLMFHYAGPGIPIPDDHIQEYLGYSLMLGYRLKENPALNGSFKAGVLSSFYNHRSITGGYINYSSFIAEVDLSYKRFGLHSTLHSGDGHKFAFGDLFYRQKNYWRTDLIWNFIQHKNVSGRFNWSLHYVDNDRMDVSQQISIIYQFGTDKD